MQNRTRIEDLPEISEFSPQITKFIRNNDYSPPAESGMNTTPVYSQQQVQQQLPPQQLQPIQTYTPIQSDDDDNLSCLKVVKHVKNCPICTHYYNSNILTYINIIGLFIIIILVWKHK